MSKESDIFEVSEVPDITTVTRKDKNIKTENKESKEGSKNNQKSQEIDSNLKKLNDDQIQFLNSIKNNNQINKNEINKNEINRNEMNKVSINKTDVTLLLNILKVVAQRGGFILEEFEIIGGLNKRLLELNK